MSRSESLSRPIRTRFAPSPSGQIHLGNLRAALINYLWARRNSGKFLLRIEDTDAATADASNVVSLVATLSKFGILHDEGPGVGGRFAPYFQSERGEIYRDNLQSLIAADLVYRCFCTKDELERERELAAKTRQPPRYSRRCANLKTTAMEQKLENKMPFFWRLRLNHLQAVQFDDLCKGSMSFGLSNFSDPALTRPDGSFTFLFANFVDDWQMEISHVFRGEDHLSNTAVQLFLYSSFKIVPPQFGHLPIILNVDGHKLSKREQHASAESLLRDGFLPDAILDYLVRLSAFDHRSPQGLADLCRAFELTVVRSGSTLRFDPEQLLWLNKEHLKSAGASQILFDLRATHSVELQRLAGVSEARILEIITLLRDEVHTELELLEFLQSVLLDSSVGLSEVEALLEGFDIQAAAAFLISLDTNLSCDGMVKAVKAFPGDRSAIFRFIRMVLTGRPTGLGLEKLVKIYGTSVFKSRFVDFSRS